MDAAKKDGRLLSTTPVIMSSPSPHSLHFSFSSPPLSWLLNDLFPVSDDSRALSGSAYLQGHAIVRWGLVFAAVVLTVIHVNMVQLQEAH